MTYICPIKLIKTIKMEDLSKLSSFALVDLRNFLGLCEDKAKTDYIHIYNYVKPEILTGIHEQLMAVEDELERRGE